MKCLNCRVDCNITSLLAGLLAGLLACWLAGWLTDVGGKWVGGMYNVCNVLYVRSGYYYDMMCTSFRGEGEGGVGVMVIMVYARQQTEPDCPCAAVCYALYIGTPNPLPIN